MRRLIVNADGLGFTPGVTAGIRETARFGIVKSTSALANFDDWQSIGRFAEEFPGVSIGIHFNLTVGRPVSDAAKVRTLCNPETGMFWGRKFPIRVMTGRIARDEMISELTAQAARLRDLGVKLSHMDGHQNKHLYPPFFNAALSVADKFGIRCIRTHRRFLATPMPQLLLYYLGHPQRAVTHTSGRILTAYAARRGMLSADRLVSPGYADSSRKFMLAFWRELPSLLPDGTSEVYCHPAYPDDPLRRYAAYVEPRRAEVEILTSSEVRDAFRQEGISLISFRDLIEEGASS